MSDEAQAESNQGLEELARTLRHEIRNQKLTAEEIASGIEKGDFSDIGPWHSGNPEVVKYQLRVLENIDSEDLEK